MQAGPPRSHERWGPLLRWGGIGRLPAPHQHPARPHRRDLAGRHVVEPTELNDEEAHGYWRDLLIVGRTLEDVLRPVKTNYNVLGRSPPPCPKRSFNEISMLFGSPSMRGDPALTEPDIATT